jgi:hypothetical protein
LPAFDFFPQLIEFFEDLSVAFVLAIEARLLPQRAVEFVAQLLKLASVDLSHVASLYDSK